MKKLLVCFCMVGFPATGYPTPYPTRPITFVVTFGPGGPSDVIARTIGTSIGKSLKTPVLIEYMPSGGGILGVMNVVNAPADGYRWLVATNSVLGIIPKLKKTPPYDPLQQLEMAGCGADYHMFLVVPTRLNIQTIQDLVSLSHARKGLNWGSASSIAHIVGEQLARQSNVRAQRVPYRGETAVVTDLIGSHLDYALVHSASPAVYANLQSGMLRALAIVHHTRSPFFPDIPTLAEVGILGLGDISSQTSFVGPKNLPKPILEIFSKALTKALGEPHVREQLSHIFASPWICSSEELTATVSANQRRIEELIRENNIPLE